MNNQNISPEEANNTPTEQEKDSQDKPLPFHNPLKPDDQTTITQEDIENEQKYKEALSERD
jgi:hypothetical protein